MGLGAQAARSLGTWPTAPAWAAGAAHRRGCRSLGTQHAPRLLRAARQRRGRLGAWRALLPHRQRLRAGSAGARQPLALLAADQEPQSRRLGGEARLGDRARGLPRWRAALAAGGRRRATRPDGRRRVTSATTVPLGYQWPYAACVGPLFMSAYLYLPVCGTR